MKSALLIVAIITGCFVAALAALHTAHVSMNFYIPLATGGVAVVAGVAGILPLAWNQSADPGTMLQKAMAGTMLHMLVAAGLSVMVIWMFPHAQRMGLIFWVLGGYWVSLLAVVWRARQTIVKASAMYGSASSVTKAYR